MDFVYWPNSQYLSPSISKWLFVKISIYLIIFIIFENLCIVTQYSIYHKISKFINLMREYIYIFSVIHLNLQLLSWNDWQSLDILVPNLQYKCIGDSQVSWAMHFHKGYLFTWVYNTLMLGVLEPNGEILVIFQYTKK
jgi:hypothetical protein